MTTTFPRSSFRVSGRSVLSHCSPVGNSGAATRPCGESARPPGGADARAGDTFDRQAVRTATAATTGSNANRPRFIGVALTLRVPDVENIAIFYDVFFSFQSHFSRVFRFIPAACCSEVVERNSLGPNEGTRDVGVDLVCGTESVRSLADRPGPHLIFSDREEREVAERRVGRADQAVARRLL